jgi:anti-anti-sigma factor
MVMNEASRPYLESSLENGILVLTLNNPHLEGEDQARILREELLAAVARNGVSKVVIDMQYTRYVSSVAFWPLLALRRQLQEKGGRLLICGLTGIVYDVFTTTKMVSGSGAVNAPFEMAPDRDAAVAKLRA